MVVQWGKALRSLAFLVTLCVAFCATMTPAQAIPNRLPIAPNWGACGLFTNENNIVRTYSKGFVLRCGGPRLNSNPRWGYRHIIKYHRDDFSRLVAPMLMQRSWRDLEDFVTEWMIVDPDRRPKSVGGGQVCRERVFWLMDARGRVVMKQRFRMYTVGNRINSVHPTTQGC